MVKTALKTDYFNIGTTLANSKRVKQPITLRAISVAIGILVALVIAFTLWIRKPDSQGLTGLRLKPQTSLPITVKNLFKGAFEVLSATLAVKE